MFNVMRRNNITLLVIWGHGSLIGKVRDTWLGDLSYTNCH